MITILDCDVPVNPDMVAAPYSASDETEAALLFASLDFAFDDIPDSEWDRLADEAQAADRAACGLLF